MTFGATPFYGCLEVVQIKSNRNRNQVNHSRVYICRPNQISQNPPNFLLVTCLYTNER